MGDQFFIEFAPAEGCASVLRSGGESLQDLQMRLQNTSNFLYSSGLEGAFLADLQSRTQRMVDQLRQIADETSEAGRDLQTVVEWSRRVDGEAFAMFQNTTSAILTPNPTDDNITTLLNQAISRGENLLSTFWATFQNNQVFAASGEVLGLSVSAELDSRLDPSNYRYDFYKRMVADIQNQQSVLEQQKQFKIHLENCIVEEREFIKDLNYQLDGNILNRVISSLPGIGDQYRLMIANTEERIASYQDLISRTEGNITATQQSIEHSLPKLDWPGDPDTWAPLATQPGHNQNLVAGCTAFVASKVYIPWDIPLGNASQWADKARNFAQTPGNDRYGMEINNLPQVGAVATWSTKNHVAFVTEIDPNNPNRIHVQHADTSVDASGNWNQEWGTWINQRDEWINIDTGWYQGAKFIHMPWSEINTQ
jgi:surface antigen